MSRRSTGLAGVWAETQRQQQRQLEADARRRRQEAQQARARERRAAQTYREYRQAEAARRTEELDARVAALQGLLATGCRAPAFDVSSLTRPEQIEPFAPGPLAQPVPMPDVEHYRAQSGWTAGRRSQAQAEARARFEQDLRAAQAAEAQRQRQLAAYQQQYRQWADARLAELRRHNAGVAQLAEGVGRGDADSVVEYFSAALYASTAWPEDFPRQVAVAYDPAARQLVLDWELPAYDVVPETRSVRYVAGTDQDKETARPPPLTSTVSPRSKRVSRACRTGGLGSMVCGGGARSSPAPLTSAPPSAWSVGTNGSLSVAGRRVCGMETSTQAPEPAPDRTPASGPAPRTAAATATTVPAQATAPEATAGDSAPAAPTTDHEPAADGSAMDGPAADTATDTSTADAPAVDAPAVDKSSVNAPVADALATDGSAADTSATDEPVADASPGDDSAVGGAGGGAAAATALAPASPARAADAADPGTAGPSTAGPVEPAADGPGMAGPEVAGRTASVPGAATAPPGAAETVPDAAETVPGAAETSAAAE
ncbi:hypothetical protein ACWEGQ_38075, partial [Streptomyces seoulensis]